MTRYLSSHISEITLACLWGLILALLGCAAAIAPGHPVPKNIYVRQFEEYWYKFDRLYPYFDYKHVDWQAVYDQYRPLASRITDEQQLVALLAKMGTTLKDVHVWLRSPDGKYTNTYNPARATDPNWDGTVLGKYVPDLSYYGGADWGFGHVEGFGYIFISDWNKRALSIDNFVAALSQLSVNSGLILDVRMNEGGDEASAYKVASLFATSPHLSEYYRYRNGPLPSDLGYARKKFLEPAQFFQYTGPVILLIGPDSFSSTENFIAAMQTLRNVTTVGATTGGASGCPKTFALANGWDYSVPVCYDMTAAGRVIEWNGIQPEVAVATTQDDFKRGDDPVLDTALMLLRAKLNTEK
jgi:carboxyl-terminal processing protease